MKRIACSVFASQLLLAACSNDKSTPPAAAPATPPAAAPATPPAKPAAAPAEAAKPPAESPKAPTETAKPPADKASAPACDDVDTAYKALMAKPEEQVQNIEIQHILISFKGAPKMPSSVTRTKEEAKALAEQVWVEVNSGGDFDALVKQYTNDSAPGIYPLNQTSRKGMVRSFGDVGFRLKVGELGVGPWDAQASPYGWHIIKRIQ
jgi:hypothetical protein